LGIASLAGRGLVDTSFDHAGPAIEAISGSGYFELKRGVEELREAISKLDSAISSGILRDVDVESASRYRAVLMKRLEEVELKIVVTDASILEKLYPLVVSKLSEIQDQQKSDSAFKPQLVQELTGKGQ